MDNATGSTAPKPFVFVLMPLAPAFDDTYKFGIKGAAQEVGAYAERLDEQIFTEGMLERIFNQIAKADIIVADMTGRNPNVFYEVGYAHALGKIVLLLTQNADDIPFDLKHRQHTVYGGSIDRLRKELIEKLKWAIGEENARKEREKQNLGDADYLDMELEGVHVRPAPIGVNGPTVNISYRAVQDNPVVLHADLRNGTLREFPSACAAYLFCSPDSPFAPSRRLASESGQAKEGSLVVSSDEAPDGLTLRYMLDWRIPSLPHGVHHALRLELTTVSEDDWYGCDAPMRIQLRFPDRHIDYPFILYVGGDS